MRAKGFGAHSDQERILEEAVYKHVQFFWEAVTRSRGRGADAGAEHGWTWPAGCQFCWL